MTPRENLFRMLRREAPERVPLDISVTGPVADEIEKRLGSRDLPTALGTDVAGISVQWADSADAWREAFREIVWPHADAPDLEIGSFGITHQRPPMESVGKAYHFRTMLHPLEAVTSVEQLEKLPWPNVKVPLDSTAMSAEVEKARQRGLAVVGGCACTVFEHAWYVRGMDHLFMDLYEGNGIGQWLLDYFMNRSCRAVEAYCAAKVDIVHLGDDVGTQRGLMMAPDFWREHLKPRLAKVIQTVREHQQQPTWVHYHSDGDVTEIIEELIEIGVDILNPVQPECMDAAEVAARFGDRIALWGMIGTQTTMPFGTPAEVRARVEEITQLARDGAAVVMAPTHVLEPDVPWENIEALVDAAKNATLGQRVS